MDSKRITASGNLEYEPRQLPAKTRIKLAWRLLRGKVIRLRFEDLVITKEAAAKAASEEKSDE